MLEPSECLDEPTVLDLATGALSDDALARVDAHLDACDECRAVVIAMGAASDVAAPSPPDVAFGRFRLLAPIGAGAMGVVYEAEDPTLGRRVALKVIRASFGDGSESDAAAIAVEARALAKLSHPNVTAIFDVGTAGDRVFLAMELVDGPTMRVWASSARSWREIREVCLQAGRGLAAAHAAGIVHRDFKPDNVLVGADRTRVADFGLAVGRRAQPTAATVKESPMGVGVGTRSSTLSGTPAYMAPERLAGASADARSDQYAYCVSAYEVLCGTHPFPVAQREQLRAAIESAVPAKPIRAKPPRWLLAALRRGMSPRPQQRFANMDALLRALQRDRFHAGVGLGVSSAIAAGAVVAYVALTPGVPDPSGCRPGAEALAPAWDDARGDELQRAVSTVRPYAAPVGISLRRGIDAWAEQWASTYDATCAIADAVLVDASMACLNDARRQASALVDAVVQQPAATAEAPSAVIEGLPDVALCPDAGRRRGVLPPGPLAAEAEVLRESIAVLRARVAAGHTAEVGEPTAAALQHAIRLGHAPTIVDAALLAAVVHRKLGSDARSMDAALAAVAAAGTIGDDRGAARAWTAQLELAAATGRYEEGAALARHVQAAVERAGSPPLIQAAMDNALGVIDDNLGHRARARTELERARRVYAEHLGVESPALAQVLTNLGNLARGERDYEGSLALHREAMRIDRVSLGDAHPAIGRHLHNIARVLLLTGAPDEAREHYERALTIKRAAYGEAHPEVARTYNSLGLLASSVADPTAAVTSFEAARVIYAALEHSELGMVEFNLAQQHAASGDCESAAPLFRAATERIGLHAGRTSRSYIELLLAAADCHVARGDVVAAAAAFDEAVPLAAALDDKVLIDRAESGAKGNAGELPQPLARRKRSPAHTEPVASPGAYVSEPGLDAP